MLCVDLHSHTFFSKCGIHSHIEMLTAARERGLAGLALTDHGPALEGRHPSTLYERMEQPVDGIRHLKGIEANVTGEDGSIDVPPWMIRHLDVVLLGQHLRFDLSSPAADWTGVMVTAMRRNPWVDLISHPTEVSFPMDMATLAAEAKKLGMALELNNSKVARQPDHKDRFLRLLACCRETGCRIAMCSDAHTVNEIGRDLEARPLLEESGLAASQVVNATVESAFAFIAERRAVRQAWLAKKMTV